MGSNLWWSVWSSCWATAILKYARYTIKIRALQCGRIGLSSFLFSFYLYARRVRHSPVICSARNEPEIEPTALKVGQRYSDILSSTVVHYYLNMIQRENNKTSSAVGYFTSDLMDVVYRSECAPLRFPLPPGVETMTKSKRKNSYNNIFSERKRSITFLIYLII